MYLQVVLVLGRHTIISTTPLVGTIGTHQLNNEITRSHLQQRILGRHMSTRMS